jgi:endonuclease G
VSSARLFKGGAPLLLAALIGGGPVWAQDTETPATAPAAEAAAATPATAPDAEATVSHVDCDASPIMAWAPEDMGDLTGMITLCREAYVARFNPQTRNPDWVVEVLNPENLKGTADRDDAKFQADPDLVRMNVETRATLPDYKGSGFDRGHQAPAGDMKRSDEVMMESFYLTNMAPQVGIGFNRGAWRKLESVVRNWAATRPGTSLIVITGPIYKDGAEKRFMDSSSGETKVQIPDAFYKIVFDTTRRRSIAFVLENKKLDFNAYKESLTTIQAIQDQTGYNFFPHWSEREATLQETNVANLWR